MRLNEIINTYDSFILDIWGVINNGQILIPYAKEFIEALNQKGKTFCLLSNAPRPSHITLQRLYSLGMTNLTVDKITTSGDLFLEQLNQYVQKKIYIIGEENNPDLMNGQDFERANFIDEAGYVLMLSVGYTEYDLTKYNMIFDEAIKLGITMLCPNPDIIVNNGVELCYTPGAYAKIYANLGGRVIYFGKPHKEAFMSVINKYGMVPAKTLMIGDSLETDVLGANNVGIDALLLLTGIHKDDAELENKVKKHGLRPKYILDNLQLQ